MSSPGVLDRAEGGDDPLQAPDHPKDTSGWSTSANSSATTITVPADFNCSTSFCIVSSRSLINPRSMSLSRGLW